jgi:hypothetical protein
MFHFSICMHMTLGVYKHMWMFSFRKFDLLMCFGPTFKCVFFFEYVHTNCALMSMSFPICEGWKCVLNTSIKINYTHLDAHLSHLNVPCVKHKINASLTPWYGSLPLTPFEIIKGGGGRGGSQLITQVPLPCSLFFTLISPQLIPSKFLPKIIP